MKRFLLLIAFILGLSVFTTSQASAQSCSAPAVASGVTVEFPGCNGSSCDLTQASCAWNSQADAASYNVTVTEVETSTIIKNNESQSASTTKVLFPITQGRTYKCDVVSVASCGTLAAAASDQLLCEADAIIDTPTPTTATTVPTSTPIPPTPTIAPPGGFFQTISIVGGVLIVIVGGILLFAL
jgi:hypothetical protein